MIASRDEETTIRSGGKLAGVGTRFGIAQSFRRHVTTSREGETRMLLRMGVCKLRIDFVQILGNKSWGDRATRSPREILAMPSRQRTSVARARVRGSRMASDRLWALATPVGQLTSQAYLE